MIAGFIVLGIIFMIILSFYLYDKISDFRYKLIKADYIIKNRIENERQEEEDREFTNKITEIILGYKFVQKQELNVEVNSILRGHEFVKDIGVEGFIWVPQDHLKKPKRK